LASRYSIIVHAAIHRLPAVFPLSIYAEAGGLISYGTNVDDLWRRAAAYADKIFKGSKPGDLPIDQPTTFEMVVNLKTAKALGLKISNSILVQATRVIE
jgi:putative ABC transport system substrate-binding protein